MLALKGKLLSSYTHIPLGGFSLSRRQCVWEFQRRPPAVLPAGPIRFKGRKTPQNNENNEENYAVRYQRVVEGQKINVQLFIFNWHRSKNTIWNQPSNNWLFSHFYYIFKIWIMNTQESAVLTVIQVYCWSPFCPLGFRNLTTYKLKKYTTGRADIYG